MLVNLYNAAASIVSTDDIGTNLSGDTAVQTNNVGNTGMMKIPQPQGPQPVANFQLNVSVSFSLSR